MSFLYSHSTECAKSKFDLFALPPTQSTIEQSQRTNCNPISTLSDDAPIEFVVPGHGDEYVDVSHTLVNLRVKIIEPDGIAATQCPPKWMSFSIKLVSPPNNDYAYRAFIKTLLNNGSDAKESHLSMGLWINDTPG